MGFYISSGIEPFVFCVTFIHFMILSAKTKYLDLIPKYLHLWTLTLKANSRCNGCGEQNIHKTCDSGLYIIKVLSFFKAMGIVMNSFHLLSLSFFLHSTGRWTLLLSMTKAFISVDQSFTGVSTSVEQSQRWSEEWPTVLGRLLTGVPALTVVCAYVKFESGWWWLEK